MHREFVFSLATCSANHTLYSLYLLCGAFGLELSIRDSDSSHFVEPVMAFMKADSFATLKSRAWSTSELAVGLGHILTDGRLEEVDDVAPFQETTSSIFLNWITVVLFDHKVQYHNCAVPHTGFVCTRFIKDHQSVCSLFRVGNDFRSWRGS